MPTTVADSSAPPPGARMALRVMQAGFVAVVLAVVTTEAFELDRFFVPKELALHLTACVAGLLALGAVRRVRPARVDAWLVSFLVAGALSTLFAQNGWLGLRALAVSVSGAALFWTARGLRAAGLERPLLGALAAGVALAAAAALAQAYGLETDYFSENRVPGGTLGNRNFVGHLAAFGLPVLLLVVVRARRGMTFALGAGGLALAAGALVLTRSRAAWLGAAAALAVLLVGLLLAPAVRRSGRTWLRFAVLLTLAGGGAALAVVLPNALSWRSDAPYLETAQGVLNYREGSGQGRLVQYRRSLALTLRDPLLGVGPGNWPVAYPAVAPRDDPSMSRSEPGRTANPWPSSDWVALLAERGVAGFLLWALVGFGLLGAAWRALRTAGDADEGLGALALLATLAGVAVTGAFDAVLLLAWPTFFVWAAAGALFPDRAPETGDDEAGRSWTMPLLLLFVALLAGAAAVRSAGQLGAMTRYAPDAAIADLERAAELDPGNYRVRLRLAQRLGRPRGCPHARAAHALFPEAVAARRLAERCE